MMALVTGCECWTERLCLALAQVRLVRAPESGRPRCSGGGLAFGSENASAQGRPLAGHAHA